jgi:hypothetical protein
MSRELIIFACTSQQVGACVIVKPNIRIVNISENICSLRGFCSFIPGLKLLVSGFFLTYPFTGIVGIV